MSGSHVVALAAAALVVAWLSGMMPETAALAEVDVPADRAPTEVSSAAWASAASSPTTTTTTGVEDWTPETSCAEACRVAFVDCSAACRDELSRDTSTDQCQVDCAKEADACTQRCEEP